MVEYITGINGTGKSKILSEAAICSAMSSKGNVIYVDSSDKLSLALPASIRLINASNYEIGSASALYGFLVGLCVSDYDLTDIFVDSTLELIANNDTEITDFMEIVSKLSDRTGVDFHFSVIDEYEKEPICNVV